MTVLASAEPRVRSSTNDSTVPRGPVLSAADLLASLAHRNETGIKWAALGIAIVIHMVVLSINFPEIRQAVRRSEAKPTVLVVKKYVPPPPQVERRQTAPRKQLTRKMPIPDPTPDEPEPIREPEPEFVPEPLPPDVEILIGIPEPPPPSPGPVLAGVGDVTNPVLIPESKITPTYPDLARIARVEGQVILQAVIQTDGSVGELNILRCNRPQMGFEEAAIEAVRQWRYTPAQQNGRPVAVYFTVFVNFDLL